MQTDNLIRMANQIGSFFDAMPDRPEAMKDLAMHIKKFWVPAMRQAFLAHLDKTGDDELNPITAEAIRLHRNLLL